MTGFWSRAAIVAAMVGTVAACSAAEPTPQGQVGSSTAQPSTSVRATPSVTTSKPPAKPRTITECLDGQCRVSVMPGDRVRLDGVMGLGALSLPFISRAKIRMRAEFPDAVGEANIPNPLREGLPGANGRRIKVVEITGSRAVIEIND